MPNLSKLRALSNREQAIVALAVLVDGHDAAQYLSSDRDRNYALERAATDLSALSPELRIPLLLSLIHI